MIEISYPALALSLIPILAVAWIAHRWAGKGLETGYATLRMLVQLIAVGYVLVALFEAKSPWIGIAVVVLMIVASSYIGIRTIREDRGTAFLHAFIAIGAGGSVVLVFILFAILRLQDPAYQPRIIIPIAGMVFSNSMTAVTIAAERFGREQATGSSYHEARAAAWNAALIPQINALFAVGLVALPGMMTGQILSGVDPLLAVRYQVVVMAMVLQSAGFSVALFLLLSRPKTA